jgi:hypothetical protein
MKKHQKSLIAIGALSLASLGANATAVINSTGIASPLTTVTFSELSFSSGTVITNQFAGFGVTTSGHHYNSQGPSPSQGSLVTTWACQPASRSFSVLAKS